MATTGWPRRPGDISGVFVAEMAQALAAQGAQVTVVAPRRGPDLPGVIVRPYAGGPLLDGGGAPERLWRRPLISLPAALYATGALSRAVAAGPPADALVAHWLLPTGPAIIRAAQRQGRPAHLYAHGSDVALLERLPAGRAWLRWMDAHAHSLIAVSADLRDRLQILLGRAPRARWSVAPMGVTVTDGDRDQARHALGLTGPTILTLGRHVPIKGLSVLVEALAGTGWTWIAAGDGPERAALQRRAAALGVEARWVGQVSPEIRGALIAAADLLAQPSVSSEGRGEGAPLAVMEALASGLPVVASAVGGIPTLLARHGGALAPPGDVEALRQAILAPPQIPRGTAGLRWAQAIDAHRRAWGHDL